MTIGQTIESLIEDNDITLVELSKILNCSTKQLSRWKNDEAEMGIYKLKALCEYFGVSADYILGLPKDSEWPR